MPGKLDKPDKQDKPDTRDTSDVVTAKTRRQPVAVRRRAHQAVAAGRSQLRRAVVVSEDQVEQALLLWLRGETYASIARVFSIHAETARELVRQAYAETAMARAARMADRVDETVARLRLVQRQAWADHDADEDRELAVLRQRGAAPQMRYPSQRGQYLRVIVDAEREIARLQGLYDAAIIAADASAETATFVLRIERQRGEEPAVVHEVAIGQAIGQAVGQAVGQALAVATAGQ